VTFVTLLLDHMIMLGYYTIMDWYLAYVISALFSLMLISCIDSCLTGLDMNSCLGAWLIVWAGVVLIDSIVDVY
jgi:hypothetical protein